MKVGTVVIETKTEKYAEIQRVRQSPLLKALS